MKHASLQDMSVDSLVERFAELGERQYRAELLGDHSAFNRHYDEIDKVRNELKGRDGDQRTALLSLYEHPNMQVRLNAAKLTLAVAPKAAREALEAIEASHHYPQAGDAGMTLFALDDGIFQPT
jgi:hypothetical protein